MSRLPWVVVRRGLTPCTCGCAGRDPWHRARYRRAVAPGLDGRLRARLPWGWEVVEPIEHDGVRSGWYAVVKESA